MASIIGRFHGVDGGDQRAVEKSAAEVGLLTPIYARNR